MELMTGIIIGGLIIGIVAAVLAVKVFLKPLLILFEAFIKNK